MNFCRTSGITKSTYEKGEMNGEFKIYELGCLAYEGGVKKGRYHGVGTDVSGEWGDSIFRTVGLWGLC